MPFHQIYEIKGVYPLKKNNSQNENIKNVISFNHRSSLCVKINNKYLKF